MNTGKTSNDLTPEMSKKFSGLIAELRQSDKVDPFKTWLKGNLTRIYFRDQSYIGLDLKGTGFSHSGGGTLAEKSLSAVGYPRRSLDESIYVTRRTGMT